MNKKIFLCAIALLTVPMSTKAGEDNESSFMAILKTPILFLKGCTSVADSINSASESFSDGSNQIGSSLENTGEDIKKAGKIVQEGLQSAGQSIERAADKVSNITHTWDPKSRLLGNAFVKESAVSVLGLSVALTGVYILYQSLHKIFLENRKQPKNNLPGRNQSRSQKIKHFLQENSQSLTAGLLGVLFSCAGLKIVQHNSYLAGTL